jgi:hypothetical protein
MLITVRQICIYIQNLHRFQKVSVWLHVQLILDVSDVLFDLQNGGSTSLQNVGEFILNCMILQYKSLYICYYIFNWCIKILFFMFSSHLKRTYLPFCSQLKLEKNRGTGLHNLCLLSPQEKLPSNPYPSLLHTTDTIKKGSSKGKVRPFETIAYCYFFYIWLKRIPE